MPGVAQADIDVSLDDGVLTVKGEKHSERKEEAHLPPARGCQGRWRGGGFLGRCPENHRAEDGGGETDGEEDHGECAMR